MRGGGRGRTDYVLASQFNIQGFYNSSSSPPRHTHSGIRAYQLRTMRLLRLLATSDCTCTLYGLGRQKMHFCDLQICLDGAASFWADKDRSFSTENYVLLFGVSFDRDTLPSPCPLFFVSITCSFIVAAHVFRTQKVHFRKVSPCVQCISPRSKKFQYWSIVVLLHQK